MSDLIFTPEIEEKVKRLSSLREVKFTDNRLDSTKRDGLTSCIRRFFLSSALDIKSSDEDYESKLNAAMKQPSTINQFATGMAIALTAGYFQALNNDVAVVERKYFGLDGLGVAFQRAVPLYLSEIPKPGESNKSLEAGLNVTLRACSAEEYFGGNLWAQDIDTLCELLATDIDAGYNKRVLAALRNQEDVSSQVETYMADIKAVYELLLADSFGIETYRGVLYSGGKFLTIVGDANEASVITEGALTLSRFADRVYDKINGKVIISDKRQFDYETIFSTKDVVYFPKKILEYALGRESQINTLRNYYKNNANSLSWESYSSTYVFPNIEDVIYRGIYKAIERILEEKKVLHGNFISQEYLSPAFNASEFIVSQLSKGDIYDRVFKLVGRVIQSIKSAYILTKFPCLAGKIAAINFRICMKPSLGGLTAEASASSHLFKNLVAENENEQFAMPVDISGGRSSSTGVAASSAIYEYQYDINPMLTKAEPLFGYTIQRLNQRKNRSAGWNNLLIGQSASGKELYASKTSDIKLQNYFIHNIIAGSRSGKGVMTMNILANALAAGKPVFYLDRKPDMASMLYGLSKGRQFIVNGGLYQPDNDPEKRFPEDGGPALEYWRNKARPYLEANPAIAELFGVAAGASPSYYGVIGDYVYFRAFMFCMGICVLRTKLAGSSMAELRTRDFNGDNGIVIVVDELTGFQASIASIFSTISSRMIQAALKVGDTKAVIAKRKELEDKISIQEHKMAEATKESQRIQAEAEISKLKRQLSELVDEQSLYAATLYKKITDNFVVLRENKVAGFKGKEFSFSDIFVLGQELSAKFYTSQDKGSMSPVFFTLKADQSNFYTDYQGADIVRSFLEELGQEDWFLGRNPDFDYAKKSLNPSAVQTLDKDGNWGYVGAHTCKQITGVEPGSFSYVLFKPYLVLNMSVENNPPTLVQGEGQYVAQCANRVNENAGGANLWETVRLKHLVSGVQATKDNPQYGMLDEGIGFTGLIADTLKTTKEGKARAGGSIEEYVIEVLGKSGDIANIIARAMHYENWQDLIFDFSPDGLFSFNDMVNAVMHPEKYTPETRLPIHSALGLLSDDSGGLGMTGSSDEFDNLFDDSAFSGVSSGGAPVSEAGDKRVNHETVPEDVSGWSNIGQAAANQFFGEQVHDGGADAVQYDDLYGDSDEEVSQPYGESVVDEREVWLFSQSVVDVAIAASGKQFSDDEVHELVDFVYQTTIDLLREG